MRNAQPFKSLGTELKNLREKTHESLAEVSGALEIDSDTLASFEKGNDKPSEETLMLLISHFAVKEDKANRLLELAGYDRQQPLQAGNEPNATVMIMPVDLRVVYTDMVHVTANDYGVVMNFMQNAGPNNQPLAISRVGMSKEHAKSVLEVLKKTIDDQERGAQTKSLPAPENPQED